MKNLEDHLALCQQEKRKLQKEYRSQQEAMGKEQHQGKQPQKQPRNNSKKTGSGVISSSSNHSDT